MRPLKLIMTGFESYKDRTEINFEELGTRGLYLITGDTGAGKTTIFDAITFALYGSPSGSDRSVEMLRSHFADANTPTTVELDFEANGKKYHITRNPDYERKALRGEGTTKEAQNAVLTFTSEGRAPVSGVSKVNSEVENILNLKKDQFCRIAMIAQGSFQKLLLSKKDEKQSIFRELFHTEKYERLQDQLKSDKSAADQTVSNLKIKLGEALTRIDVTEKDEDFENISRIKNSGYINDEEIQVLKAFTAKDEKLFLEITDKTEKIEKKLEKTNAELQHGEERSRLQEEISALEISGKEKSNKLPDLETALEAAKKAAEQISGMEKEKNLIEASLGKYKEVADAEKELAKLSSEISTDVKNQTALEQTKAGLTQKSDDLKSEQALLKNAGQKTGTLEAAISKNSDEQNDLKEIKTKLADLETTKEDLAIAQGEARKAIADYEAANSSYTDMLRLFNLEQAGILAEGLREGCACPVCGSTSHPHPAKKSQKAPDAKELEKAKKAADELQKKSSQISVKAGQKKTEVEKSEENINSLLKKYFKSLSASDEQVLLKIEKRIDDLTSDAEKIKAELQKEKADKARREEIEGQIPEIEQQLEDKDSQLTQLLAKIAGNKAKQESESKNLAEKKSGLKYQTLQAAQEKFNELEKQILQLNENVETAQNNKNNCEIEIENFKGKVESLKNQLEKIKPVDVEKLSEEKQKLTGQKAALNEQRDSINERKGKNIESVQTVEKLVPEINAAINRYNMISALSEVAAGTSRGKNGKPSLETYVQMHCLDQINLRANLRLKTMTENKYELRRRIEEDGSELGLDLNIKDFYTGRQRSVQTLSGGEQFQASLALALGLADEVQENSGGIKLDTMFIDEGFGTLDSETLNKAMHALEDLSQGNKLVGIISHVEELESRIDNKIVVTKNSLGISSAVIKKE